MKKYIFPVALIAAQICAGRTYGYEQCFGSGSCNDADYSEIGQIYVSCPDANGATCTCGGNTYQCGCIENEYGTSGSNCQPCPDFGDISGTSEPGSKTITSCRIESGWTITDSTGTYTFTTDCYYTN